MFITQPLLDFIIQLHVKFEHRRQTLLERRIQKQKYIDNGGSLDFWRKPHGSAIVNGKVQRYHMI